MFYDGDACDSEIWHLAFRTLLLDIEKLKEKAVYSQFSFRFIKI